MNKVVKFCNQPQIMTTQYTCTILEKKLKGQVSPPYWLIWLTGSVKTNTKYGTTNTLKENKKPCFDKVNFILQ